MWLVSAIPVVTSSRCLLRILLGEEFRKEVRHLFIMIQNFDGLTLSSLSPNALSTVNYLYYC